MSEETHESIQIKLTAPSRLVEMIDKTVKEKGYMNRQDFILDVVRRELVKEEKIVFGGRPR